MTKLDTLNAEKNEIQRTIAVLQEQLDAARTIEKRVLWDILVETNKVKAEENRRAIEKKMKRGPSKRQIEVLIRLTQNGRITRHKHHGSGTLFYVNPGAFASSTDIVSEATLKTLLSFGFINVRYDGMPTVYHITDEGRAYLESLKK